MCFHSRQALLVQAQRLQLLCLYARPNIALWNHSCVKHTLGRQAALGPRTTVFLSDVETEVWAPGTVRALAERSARWLVTLGEHGADEWLPGVNASRRLPAQKARPAMLLAIPGHAGDVGWLPGVYFSRCLIVQEVVPRQSTALLGMRFSKTVIGLLGEMSAVT